MPQVWWSFNVLSYDPVTYCNIPYLCIKTKSLGCFICTSPRWVSATSSSCLSPYPSPLDFWNIYRISANSCRDNSHCGGSHHWVTVYRILNWRTSNIRSFNDSRWLCVEPNRVVVFQQMVVAKQLDPYNQHKKLFFGGQCQGLFLTGWRLQY